MYILAVIAEVNSQIHEVVFAKARFIHNFLQHSLVNFIGDIAKHNLVRVSVAHSNIQGINLL